MVRKKAVSVVAKRWVRRFGQAGTTWKADKNPRYSGPSTSFNKKRQGKWWDSGSSWGAKTTTAKRALRSDLVNTAISDSLKTKGVSRNNYGTKKRTRLTTVGAIARRVKRAKR